ncbi:MAG: type VI secretion system ATPase TssH, partial [Pseudomonadota bacterium]
RIMDLWQDGSDAVTQEQVKAAVMPVVSRHFRPELINRIDEVVVFHPLQQTQMRGIAEIQIASLQQRLADLDLQLQLDSGVLDKLASLGFDPVYGARPLKRAIQQWLENPLAQEVLKGTYPPGSTIVVSLVGQDIAFSKKAKAV